MKMKDVSEARKQYRRIIDVIVATRKVDNELVEAGPKLIKMLLASGEMSLRDLAKKSRLSPTYLSQVQNGKTVISKGGYVHLMNAAGLVRVF